MQENDPRTFTYDCQSVYHEGNPIDMPDACFPTPEEVKQGMEPEICFHCQNVVCNMCGWRGNDDGLEIVSKMYDEGMEHTQACPNCLTDAYLMNVRRENACISSV